MDTMVLRHLGVTRRAQQLSFAAEGDDDTLSVLMSKLQPSSLHDEKTTTQMMPQEFLNEMNALDVRHTMRYASFNTPISEWTRLLHGHHGSETSWSGK